MQTAPNNRQLSALYYSDKDEWRRRCNEALREAKGHRARAAKKLKISVRVLYRWIAKEPRILTGVSEYRPTPEEAARMNTRRLRTLRSNGNGAKS